MAVQTAEPVWEIATLFPNQGQWSQEEYLNLETNRLVEFDNGILAVQPVPTDQHQAIVLFLLLRFKALIDRQGGTVRPAGIRVQLWPGKFREPDVVFQLAESQRQRYQPYWTGADLVVEVVSGGPQDRERDLVIKRNEYAQAGIPEYWIVDPQEERVHVLCLDGDSYVEHGRFNRGDRATSALLPGFVVDMDDLFDAD